MNILEKVPSPIWNLLVFIRLDPLSLLSALGTCRLWSRYSNMEFLIEYINFQTSEKHLSLRELKTIFNKFAIIYYRDELIRFKNSIPPKYLNMSYELPITILSHKEGRENWREMVKNSDNIIQIYLLIIEFVKNIAPEFISWSKEDKKEWKKILFSSPSKIGDQLLYLEGKINPDCIETPIASLHALQLANPPQSMIIQKMIEFDNCLKSSAFRSEWKSKLHISSTNQDKSNANTKLTSSPNIPLNEWDTMVQKCSDISKLALLLEKLKQNHLRNFDPFIGSLKEQLPLPQKNKNYHFFYPLEIKILYKINHLNDVQSKLLSLLDRSWSPNSQTVLFMNVTERMNTLIKKRFYQDLIVELVSNIKSSTFINNFHLNQ
eukprot:TRINITY_DN5884_c0_g1_i2.p1 TRINITY_DN5884_c0_g1~~TRINITY_DN5884_c0_g1_i2.p1  ORF type:complete len:377 (+),score=79.13 TRINITY_DN5884_c0_g1_i2:76-1206(+)